MGQSLKDLIKSAGLTQRDLAKKTGIAEGTINTWVIGRAVPRLDNALILCRYLGVSLKELSRAMGLNITDVPNDSDDDGPK
ncbi:MAG TPA: helix-turn-helix transcriptional regulator [Fusibacter sp.]|nr:helix-turn-helix transcriptional regulator [Fusibacter sp.]